MEVKVLVFVILFFGSSMAQDIKCVYEYSNFEGVILYTCNLEIQNSEGFDNFTTVGGTHLPGRTDADVIALQKSFSSGINPKTTIFPKILCSQFSNLEKISFFKIGLERIFEDTFSNCVNLTYLNILGNFINDVHERAFVHNIKLQKLDLSNNKMTEFPEDIFDSLISLQFLDISFNPLVNIPDGLFKGLTNLIALYIDGLNLNALNPAWFENIPNLGGLSIESNNFTSISGDIFSALKNLFGLSIRRNPIGDNIAPGTFRELINIQELRMDEIGITELHPAWFENLTQLSILTLDDNKISFLPNGIFSSTDNLSRLDMSRNKLRTLSRNAFGSIKNIDYIFLSENNINAIDERFLREVSPLYLFYLQNNLCINDIFGMFYENRDKYINSSFKSCIRNFELIVDTSTVTGDSYKFFQAPSTTGIDLWINTNQEVRIALTPFNFLWNPSVEIVIGTNNNTLSTIIRNQVTQVVAAQSRNIIRSGQWIQLRITWVNNVILVSRDGQDFPFLAYNLEYVFPVGFYGLRSPESQANWSIRPI